MMSMATALELFTDSLHRLAYATDASAYRQLPVAVAYPRSEDDVHYLLQEARRRHTCLIPRAAGTSIAGQVVGDGIVVDCSRYMNSILSIDVEHRLVTVQPGVVRDELNRALRPYGLFFSPETSTSNRCCLGGMAGNNSCGTHSLIYGSTRHHVVGIRLMLSDGSTVEWSTNTPPQTGDSPLARHILEQLASWQHDDTIRSLLTTAFPDSSLRRRSCGYALDECLLPDIINMPALLVGSEGTLAFTLSLTLSLDVLPPAHVMVDCVHLRSLNEAWRANLIALDLHPSAIELMDGRILELAKGNLEAQRNRFFVQGDPAAMLIVEFRADTQEQLQAQADHLEDTLRAQLPSETDLLFSRVYDADVDRVWALRKAGLGVLSTMHGEAKPVGVIEDTAIAPERLEAFMTDFAQMMQRLGLDCVYYGHISTGELHLRPVLDLHQEADRNLFRQVAAETALLVRRHHGSLSGEHGDGRLRGEFIPLVYGDEVYQLFRRLKQLFDPDGVFNTGKIVDTPPMDEWLRATQVNTHDSLVRHAERCNGAGDCRRSQLFAGTMCPTYRLTTDELMSTRARANILREYLSDSSACTTAQVHDVLDSCLACKGCRSECPSNIDMTTLRARVLQRMYDHTHLPLRTWLVSHIAWWQRLGNLVPMLYNRVVTCSWTSALLRSVLHFASERSIPTLSRYSLRRLVHRESVADVSVAGRRIYLFADEFTSYQEAELGLQFVRMVRRLGYEVIIPHHTESGRAALSKGCVRHAERIARRNTALLAPLVSDSAPLVGIEPSCILTLRDEYPGLVDGDLHEQAEHLSRHSLLYDEWLMGELQQGHIDPSAFHSIAGLLPQAVSPLVLYLHGHCHQKALVGVEKTADCLRLIPDLEVRVIPSGCCGMAGSFGYERDHYATSMAIGEQVLFPAIRRAREQEGEHCLVLAPGTSCRQQILDGTGIHAYHPLELLARSVLYCEQAFTGRHVKTLGG